MSLKCPLINTKGCKLEQRKGITMTKICSEEPLSCVDEEGLPTEIAVLKRLAKIGQQMQWIPVTERLPDNSKPVLAVVKEEMVTYVLRVMYARKFDIESETDYDEELFDYVEETDTYYCKPGWYENNVFEDIHWGICGEVTHWMELPKPPKEGD